MKNLDSNEFRNALGQFATGVTVITSVNSQGNPVGVTASSFNSVSLEPPLVLWSLAKNADSLAAYQTSGYFCVHVLNAEQEALSQRFSARGVDKFAGLKWDKGIGSVPLLLDYAAQFQCKTTYQYEGGDHVIFVGEVFEYQVRDDQPLVFHRGSYATAKVKNNTKAVTDSIDIAQGKFSDNFFLYLLSRAYFQASYDLHNELKANDLAINEYLSLTLIGLVGEMSYQNLHERLEHTANAPTMAAINKMLARGLLTETADATQFVLTVKGRSLYVSLLALSKATEERLLADFSNEEVADVRSFLKRFIEKSDLSTPSLWANQ